jgi:hypothetical protein
MARGGADEALRGRGGWDTAEPDAGAFSESGPGSEAPAGPERDVDIGTPFLGGASNSRRSDEWRYRTISSLGVALDERLSSGRAHQYPIRPTLPDGHSSDHCTLDPPASIVPDASESSATKLVGGAFRGDASCSHPGGRRFAQRGRAHAADGRRSQDPYRPDLRMRSATDGPAYGGRALGPAP